MTSVRRIMCLSSKGCLVESYMKALQQCPQLSDCVEIFYESSPIPRMRVKNKFGKRLAPRNILSPRKTTNRPKSSPTRRKGRLVTPQSRRSLSPRKRSVNKKATYQTQKATTTPIRTNLTKTSTVSSPDNTVSSPDNTKIEKVN